MKDLERRFYDVELVTREEEEMGVVIGRPIVYGQVANIGLFDEIIMPGALDGADLTDVRLCLNHDTSYVYARSRRNNPNSTMRLTPDMSGLMIEADQLPVHFLASHPSYGRKEAVMMSNQKSLNFSGQLSPWVIHR